MPRGAERGAEGDEEATWSSGTGETAVKCHESSGQSFVLMTWDTERIVTKLADERELIQKKTFTKWVNSHLQKAGQQIEDLYRDLRDGHSLISLLEVLSGEKLKRERGKLRVHRLQNVSFALDFLQKRQVKLVNIRSEEIVDGNSKLILGLIWTIILHFQVSEIQVEGQNKKLTAQNGLLLWVRQMTDGYHELRCENFTTSWRDGKLFNAIIHKHRPDLVDMEKVYVRHARENLEHAFSTAERNLHVPQLLDPEDVDVETPDEKSIVTYVSTLYDAFPKFQNGSSSIAINDVDDKSTEYVRHARALLAWLKDHTTKLTERGLPEDPMEIKAMRAWLLQLKEQEVPKREKEKEALLTLHQALQVWVEFGRVQIPEELSVKEVNKAWNVFLETLMSKELSVEDHEKRMSQEAEKAAQKKLSDINEILTKIRQMQVDLDSRRWPNSLSELNIDLEKHTQFGMVLETLCSLVKKAQMQVDVPAWLKEEYGKCLIEVDSELERLMDSSAARKSHLESLVEFLRPLEEQSGWLTKAIEREETFDWSDKNSEMERKRKSHLEFQAELARREPSIKRLEKAGEVLTAQGHPTSSFIKTALHDLKNRWHWVLQLCDCVETHLQENTKYFQFFEDLNKAEKNLEGMQQSVKTTLYWNTDSGLEGINKILANPPDQKEAEFLRARVEDLLQRAVTVVQLKPRGSGQHEISSLPLRAACECSHGKVTVSRGEECRLDGKAEGKEWTVSCRDGNSVQLPSVCFTMGPPNLEAKQRSVRLEQQLDKVKQQIIGGSEELEVTRDLLIHIQKICGWAGDKTVEAEKLITAQKELELQHHHFRERSQEGLVIDVTARARVEAKAEACWARLQQMQRENAESEAACRRYISALLNIRLQLEACEGRAAAPGGVHKYEQHMASLKQEVEELSTTLEGISQEASSFLAESPSVPSVPSLRSELRISAETLQRLRLLSSKLPEVVEVNGNILSMVEDSLRTTKLLGHGGMSMWDLLWDVEMSEEERQQLVKDFHLGKLSAEQLRETLEVKQNERRKMDLKLPGLRQEVSIKDLEESLILDKATADGLVQGKKMMAEVSESLARFLGGSRSIAGLYIEKTKQKVSLYKAMKLGFLRPATTLELLEAQAATGYMIDPVGNTQLSVEEAVRKGLIGAEFKDKLLSAERAITGYKDPQTGNKISLFQAMQKGLILRSHGIRLLEAQIATGGIIDPQASHRLPIKVAYSRGLFDEEINRHLTDPYSETKGFLDPNTEENLTYVQLIEQCITDDDTGLRLLVLKEKQPWSKISQDIVIAQIEQIQNVHGENTSMETKPNISERIVSKSETRYIVIETQLVEELKKLKLEIPCGKNSGKELTLQEIFDGNLFDEETKKKLMADYRSGKITKAMLLSRISELLIEKESSSKYLKFSGIRRDLTMDELVSSGVIDEVTATDLTRGSKTVEEVSDSIRGYLSGTGCLAGLFIESTQETIPIYAALQRGFIRPGTALELLEAQAATGHIIDPVKHVRLTVEEAAKAGLVGDEFRTKLLSAEGAVMGYNDPYTGKRISLFQALKRNLIVKHHGVRLLEAQIATGGIIDPQASHRLPVETAYSRGLFDKEMNRILSDATEDTKGFFDPNTQENLTYKKLLSRCFADSKTNLLLLPLKEKRAASSSLQQRKIFVVDEELGKQMSIQQAYREKYINQELFQHLSGKECEWEEIISQSPEKESTMLVDRKSGLQFNIDDALADGLIDQAIIDKYRMHQLSLFDLGSQLLAASKVRASSNASTSGNVVAQRAALSQKC